VGVYDVCVGCVGGVGGGGGGGVGGGGVGGGGGGGGGVWYLESALARHLIILVLYVVF